MPEPEESRADTPNDQVPDDPTSLPADRGWQRLRTTVTMRPGRDQWVIAVLCALLGFGIVLQVRSINSEQTLVSARPEDLVRLLDSLDQRSQRLNVEIAELEETKDRLAGARDKDAAAQAEREERDLVLGVLAGVVPARGPGIEARFAGPVDSVLLLDAVQELRDAGAEAMQVGNVRIVASTSFVDGPVDGTIEVDGQPVTAPFVLKAIGAPVTMTSALRIPGGIADSAAATDVDLSITAETQVEVTAVRTLPTPQSARP